MSAANHYFRTTGDERVWVSDDGVFVETIGTRLDSDWGCDMEQFATRTDLHQHIERHHGADVLSEVRHVVAQRLNELRAPTPPAAGARPAEQVFAQTETTFKQLVNDLATVLAVELVPSLDSLVWAIEEQVLDGASGPYSEHAAAQATADQIDLRFRIERSYWNPTTFARGFAMVSLRLGAGQLRVVGDETGSVEVRLEHMAASEEARLLPVLHRWLPTALIAR